MAQVEKIKPQSVGFYKYHDIILGKGNFATVYRARHKIIGCEVALKVINIDAIEEEYVSRNLTREARILRMLHHPNIVRLYETVKSVNLYCLSLELVRGANLYQYMMKQENHRISERLARIFFYQMLSAVDHMHRFHVIHRDLKLENVLVDCGHVIKIVDFGLSNVYYPCYRLRTHCGSVEYAAPELFRSMSVYGSAADLWSLGVILYAMVVGKMPFMFSRINPECTESSRKRELFLQRISKGLMQENWELMENLSQDCWNILHDMLHPDQFKRIRIKDALGHHWIAKDEHLKRRLPQKRKDLQRKFHPEIIDFLAYKLQISRSRVEKHISGTGHQSDRVTSMFHIVRDVLMKEVLYPPKEFETSFLYHFEIWRQNKPLTHYIQQNREFWNDERFRERKTISSNSTARSTFVVNNKAEFPTTSSTNSKESEEGELSNHPKRVAILKPPENNIKKNNLASKEAAVENLNNIGHVTEPQRISRASFRSHKNSRPQRAKPKYLNELYDRICENVYENEPTTSNINNDCHEEREKTVGKYDNGFTPPETREESYLMSDKSHKHISQKTYTRSKSSGRSVLEATTTGEINPTEIPPESKLPSNNIDRSKIVHFAKVKPENIVKATKNHLNSPKNVTKQSEENRISVLKRTHPKKDLIKKENASVKAAYSEIPSKIPINVQYGPPAPFSQPVNKTVKSRRMTIGNKISLSGGDTAEGLP